MKIQHLIHSKKRGSVLLITLLICAALFIFMASYLYLIQAQSLAVSRSQAWNYAIVVAESGVEEGMAHLNSGVGINNLGTNGWISLKNSSYLKTNQLGTSYSAVTINAANPAVPVITATAYVPGPLNTPNLTRTVQVSASPISGTVPPGAMVVNTSVTFKGSGISTDSFNSTNLVKFPGGLYNIANREDNGDVVTLSNAAALIINDGTVRGTLHAASGLIGDVTIKPNGGGSVGSNTWVDIGKNGIETNPDRFKADVNFTFPDATLPDTGGIIWLPLDTTGGMSGTINGVYYKYVLSGTNIMTGKATPWTISTLDGGVYVANPGVLLKVTSGFSLGSGDQFMIASKTNGGVVTTGNLKLYVTAPTASIGGNGIINNTGLAKNFQYFGLPQNTSLSFQANTAVVGVIYAPEADFTLGGGGNNTYDFIGQCVTKSSLLNGHFNFHYDEGIQISTGANGYVVISWDEL